MIVTSDYTKSSLILLSFTKNYRVQISWIHHFLYKFNIANPLFNETHHHEFRPNDTLIHLYPCFYVVFEIKNRVCSNVFRQLCLLTLFFHAFEHTIYAVSLPNLAAKNTLFAMLSKTIQPGTVKQNSR